MRQGLYTVTKNTKVTRQQKNLDKVDKSVLDFIFISKYIEFQNDPENMQKRFGSSDHHLIHAIIQKIHPL